MHVSSERPTMRDVARLTATVSHVINGTGAISAGSEQRVRVAIAGLNYRPNLQARELAGWRRQAVEA
jgi:DNA-binding LacI/PurR family transcriptional regulator